MISISGVCVSAYGLYLQREQLMGYFKKSETAEHRQTKVKPEIKP